MSRSIREIKAMTAAYLHQLDMGPCDVAPQDMREIMEGFVVLNDELERQRAENAKAHVALREAQERVKAGVEAKTRFLTDVSHELRTPLNSVMGMTELLLQTELDGEQRRFARALGSSALSLLMVLDEVLDTAKIESGQLQVQTQTFDLEATLVTLMERFMLQADEGGLQLRLCHGPGIPRYLTGDASRLSQILTNFIGNALKFTDHGSVTLEVGHESGTDRAAVLRFSVQDTGRGIPADQLEQLFEPFGHLDASTKRTTSGTGLGLAICRQLASLMEGEVGASSRVGRGSTFWLQVPFDIDPARAEARLVEGLRSWGADATREPPPPPALASAKPPSPSHRVLLVEDNQINRMVAARMLEKLGCTVETAKDGVEGLRRAKDRAYDLIFMDCQMPRMDGFETTAAIRAQVEHGSRIPIIAMTAQVMTGDRERCLAAGMNDYIAKPVSPGTLAAVVRHYSGASRARASV